MGTICDGWWTSRRAHECGHGSDLYALMQRESSAWQLARQYNKRLAAGCREMLAIECNCASQNRNYSVLM